MASSVAKSLERGFAPEFIGLSVNVTGYLPELVLEDEMNRLDLKQASLLSAFRAKSLSRIDEQRIRETGLAFGIDTMKSQQSTA